MQSISEEKAINVFVHQLPREVHLSFVDAVTWMLHLSQERDDCTVVHVPSDCIGYITGARRATLGQMEEESMP